MTQPSGTSATDPTAVIHREFLHFLEYFAEPDDPHSNHDAADGTWEEHRPYIERLKA